jgi:hypothetical protein
MYHYFLRIFFFFFFLNFGAVPGTLFIYFVIFLRYIYIILPRDVLLLGIFLPELGK